MPHQGSPPELLSLISLQPLAAASKILDVLLGQPCKISTPPFARRAEFKASVGGLNYAINK
jgi:hypothetical protein